MMTRTIRKRREKKMRLFMLCLHYHAATALLILLVVLLLLNLTTKASPIQFQDLDFVVALTDESFEHETQASTGQTTGSWLIWFYNDNDNENNQAANTILGQVPQGGTIFSDHHIVLGSVSLANKSTRTRQRFAIKPKYLPALIFIHKTKYYVYPKGSSSSSSESFYFNWDSIVKFAFHIAGYKQPSSSSSAAAEQDGGDESSGEEEEEKEGVVQQQQQQQEQSNSIFANLQAHDIPDPKTDWDDFQDFLTSMFNDGGFFFSCIAVVFVGLGIAALFNQMTLSKKEKTNKKKQS